MSQPAGGPAATRDVVLASAEFITRNATASPRARRHVLLYFSALAANEFYPAEFAAA